LRSQELAQNLLTILPKEMHKTHLRMEKLLGGQRKSVLRRIQTKDYWDEVKTKIIKVNKDETTKM